MRTFNETYIWLSNKIKSKHNLFRKIKDCYKRINKTVGLHTDKDANGHVNALSWKREWACVRVCVPNKCGRYTSSTIIYLLTKLYGYVDILTIQNPRLAACKSTNDNVCTFLK